MNDDIPRTFTIENIPNTFNLPEYTETAAGNDLLLDPADFEVKLVKEPISEEEWLNSLEGEPGEQGPGLLITYEDVCDMEKAKEFNRSLDAIVVADEASLFRNVVKLVKGSGYVPQSNEHAHIELFLKCGTDVGLVVLEAEETNGAWGSLRVDYPTSLADTKFTMAVRAFSYNFGAQYKAGDNVRVLSNKEFNYLKKFFKFVPAN